LPVLLRELLELHLNRLELLGKRVDLPLFARSGLLCEAGVAGAHGSDERERS
jgi:hypothetical protein